LLIFFSNTIYIWLKYVLHKIDILSIYDQQTIYIWILVGRFESWSSNTHCIVLPIHLPLCFLIKVIIFWIYNNYTTLFYKSNFNIYSFSHVFQMKQMNSFLNFFQGSTHIYNKNYKKIPNHLKENTFEFCCLITTQKIFFMRKYDLTSCNIFYAKEFIENISKM